MSKNKLDRIIKIIRNISRLTLILLSVCNLMFLENTDVEELTYIIIIFGVLILFNANKPE